eukprot:TRINITY_DN3025_c0_g2_i1.p1 TRINITY_DN3025_c0_g2~~TRINITY_DN3025_c0_g2_i1.p1  ORF type:complete len:178 (-),score=4.20 TRINITY_DN3025_c0_g2_i1:5-538(-)
MRCLCGGKVFGSTFDSAVVWEAQNHYHQGSGSGSGTGGIAGRGGSNNSMMMVSAIPPQIQHDAAFPSAESLCFSCDNSQPLRGSPLLEGPVWILLSNSKAQSVRAEVFVNGFSFTLKDTRHDIVFSPFCTIRPCTLPQSPMVAPSYSDADESLSHSFVKTLHLFKVCLLYTSPSPRD